MLFVNLINAVHYANICKPTPDSLNLCVVMHVCMNCNQQKQTIEENLYWMKIKKNMQQKTRQGCTLKNHNKTNVRLVMSNKVIL